MYIYIYVYTHTHRDIAPRWLLRLRPTLRWPTPSPRCRRPSAGSPRSSSGPRRYFHWPPPLPPPGPRRRPRPFPLRTSFPNWRAQFRPKDSQTVYNTKGTRAHSQRELMQQNKRAWTRCAVCATTPRGSGEPGGSERGECVRGEINSLCLVRGICFCGVVCGVVHVVCCVLLFLSCVRVGDLFIFIPSEDRVGFKVPCAPVK